MKKSLTLVLASLMLAMGACTSSPEKQMKDNISTLNLEVLPQRWVKGGWENHAGYGIDKYEISFERPDQFRHAHLPLFNEDVAAVRIEKVRALINTEGETLIDFEGYSDFISYMTEGIIFAYPKDSRTTVALNSKGEEQFKFDGTIVSPMRAGYVLYSQENHRNDNGVVNSKGEIVYQAGGDGRISDLVLAYFGSAPSMAHPTWFPLTKEGRLICFIDVASGKRIFEGLWPEGARLPLNMPLAFDANDRLVIEASRDNYGLMKLDGTWAVEPQYRYLTYDGQWYMFENSDGMVGWMDKDGNVTIEPKFDVARRSETKFGVSDWCLVNPARGNTFFIDRKGETVLNPRYIAVSNFINDRCLVNLGGNRGYSWMDRKGDLIGSPILLTEYAVKTIAEIGQGNAVQYKGTLPFL